MSPDDITTKSTDEMILFSCLLLFEMEVCTKRYLKNINRLQIGGSMPTYDELKTGLIGI